jgi:septum formation protein
MKKPILYLASRSPRRKDLLRQAGLGFRVYVPKKEELIAPKLLRNRSPARIVERIAAAKGRAALKELREQGIRAGLILSADTLVFQNGKVLGKPASKAEAKRMLRQLSGSWHLVCTGVSCLKFGPGGTKEKTIHVNSRVKFFPLKEAWLDWYVATGEPMDKAGSYGAQGFGAAFIQRFSGSYSNVVGLPLGETLALVERMAGQDRSGILRRR